MPGTSSYTGLLANGAASIVLYALPPGDYEVTAVYAGDTTYAASSRPASIDFQVTTTPPARTSTAMSWVPQTSVVQSGIIWPDSILNATSSTLGTFGYSLVNNVNAAVVPVIALPPLMTKSLTVGPISSGTSPIANLTPMTSSVFRYEGAVVGPSGTDWPGSLFYGSHFAGCPDSSMPFSVEFITTTSWFELMQFGTGSRMRIWVDGAPASRYDTIPALPANSGFYLQRFDFGTAATRRIKLQFGGGFWFGGIVTPNGSSDLMAIGEPPSPLFVVMGDSYTEGTGATGQISYAETLAESLGIKNLYASGCGGTGYINPGSYNRVAFGGRLKADVIDLKPQVVLWAGGINDESYSYNDIYNAALTDYQAVASALPNVQQIVVGPWSRGTPLTSGAQTAHDAIKAAASALGVSFVDNVDETWITGTRSKPASGNAYEYISSDETHPTQAGHDYIGNRLALDLIPILEAQTPAPGSYQMTATFAPSDSLTYSGTSLAVQPFLVQGSPPVLLSATSLDFGDIVLGTQSNVKLVTLKNLQSYSLLLKSIAFTGAHPTQYLISNNCGTSLGPNASCTIRVRFKPYIKGTLTAALAISDNANDSPQSVTLTGTAVEAPVASLSAANLSFGGQNINTQSAAQTVSVTNISNGVITIGNITLTGAHPTQFLTSDDCGASIEPSAFCTIHVRFKPYIKGTIAAALTITSNGGGSPQSVALTGTSQ